MATVRIVIFETAIHAMFQPGGMVYEETKDAAREVKFLAELDAPSRTGELRASIRIASERRASRTMVGYYVRADAPYAYFVHEGTNDIEAAEGSYMLVPRFPEYGPRGVSPKVKRDSVAGQEANPFLANNLRYVMAKVT